jgi:hypothetical protein
MAEIDHEYTEFIVCPYCGYSHPESYEFGDGGEGDGQDECESCGKEFRWSRMVSISYSTRKITDDNSTS